MSTATATSVLPFSFIIGLALLNRTILLSFLYQYVHSPTSHALSLFASVELVSALVSSVAAARWFTSHSHSHNNHAGVLIAITVASSHALFSSASSAVSVPATIFSLVLAVFDLRPQISFFLHSKVHVFMATCIAFGIIGVISLYPTLNTISAFIVIAAGCVLPTVLLRSDSVASLLSWRPLAIAAALNGFMALFMGAFSFDAVLPNPFVNSVLLAMNAAIATFALHSLSAVNHGSHTAVSLIVAALISLLVTGVPHDLLAVHPILTKFLIPLIVVPTLAILWSLVKGTSSSSHEPFKRVHEYTEVMEDSRVYSMNAFTRSMSFKHAKDGSDYDHSDDQTLPISARGSPLRKSSSDCDSPDIHGHAKHEPTPAITWAWTWFMSAVACVVTTLILSQSLSSSRIQGADPCSQLLFDERLPQQSNGTHVLVTGGAGFIGSNLAEMLLDLGYKVRVLDNLATGSFANIVHLQDHAQFEFVLGDITNRHNVESAMEGIEYVYHLAAMSKVVPSLHDPAMAKYCMDTNAGGSHIVLDISRNKKVKKVIYAASSTYYGNGQLAMHESDRPDLLTPYASSKYEGEIQMDIFDQIFHLPTISIRFFMVYGPRQPTTGAYAIVTGVFVNKMQSNTSLPIEGDGTHFRDFIHVRDIGTSLILAQQSDLHNVVINSGTGMGHSVHEVADLVSPDHVHVAPRDHDLVGTLANTCRAKSELGFIAKRDFITEMSRMIADARNPDRVTQSPMFKQLAVKLSASPWLLPTNSLVHVFKPHAEDLSGAALAASAKDDNSKKLVVIAFSKETRALVENTYYTLIKYGQVGSILLVSSRAQDMVECLSMNTACYNANGSPLVTVVGTLIHKGWIVHVAEPGTAYLRAVWPSVMALLNKTGASMIVPDNGNTGANLHHYTATPPASPLFKSLGSQGQKSIHLNMAYSNAIFVCTSKKECTVVAMTQAKVSVAVFAAPYACLGSKIPAPSTLCSSKWEHVFYMNAACMGQSTSYVAQALTKAKSWFMVPNTCPKMADSCLGIPLDVLRQSNEWPEKAACLGKEARLMAPPTPSVSSEMQLNVLVVGGAGFVGSHLVRAVLNESPHAPAKSYRVTVLDNLSTAGIASVAGLIARNDSFSFMHGSASDHALVSKIIESTQPRVVVHLGMPRPDGCDGACQKEIVATTKTLLDAFSKTVRPPKSDARFIFCSSSDVYGPAPSESKAKEESSFLNPKTPFASGLAESEALILKRTPDLGITTVILRMFPIFGPLAVPSPLDTSPLRWSSIGILATKDTALPYDWVHVQDVVDAVVLSIQRPNLSGTTVLNVGTGVMKRISSTGGISALSTRASTTGFAANLDKISHVLGYGPKRTSESHVAEPEPQAHPEFQPMVDALGSAPWLLPRGLLRNQMVSLSNDLEAIARYASQNTFKLSIIPYQKKYRVYAENILHSLIQYGNAKNTMLFAIDKESAEECLWWNFPCFNATGLAVADFNRENEYSNRMWAVISWVKPRLVAKLMDLGYSVHMTDTDIGYVRDVWGSYESYMDPVGADVSMAFESGDFIGNTGNYIVRPTEFAKGFFRKYLAIGERDPTISDQHAFTQVFKEEKMDYCQTREACDAVHSKGQMAIRDYSSFFGRFNICPHEIDICKRNLIYLHPICVTPASDKINVIKKFGVYYMAEHEMPFYCAEAKAVGAEVCPSVPSALLKSIPLDKNMPFWCSRSVASLNVAEES